MAELNATERLQVVYESEPLESGLAAAALPALPAGFLRGLLGEILPTSLEVDALAIDYFPEIKRRFTDGMERGQRESLLLLHAPPHALYRALRTMLGEKCLRPAAKLAEYGFRRAASENAQHTQARIVH